MTIVLAFLALALTVLGIAVGYMAWRNGQVIKENTDRMLQAQEEILNEIKEMRREQKESTEKILQAQKESTEKILQAQKESTEKILNKIKEINRMQVEILKTRKLGFRILCLLILTKDEDERKMYAKKLLEKL